MWLGQWHSTDVAIKQLGSLRELGVGDAAAAEEPQQQEAGSAGAAFVCNQIKSGTAFAVQLTLLPNLASPPAALSAAAASAQPAEEGEEVQRAALREVQLLQSLRHPHILLLMGLALQPAALVTGASPRCRSHRRCCSLWPAVCLSLNFNFLSGCMRADDDDCFMLFVAVPAEYCSRGSLHDLLHAARSNPELAAELSWPQRLACLVDAAKASGCSSSSSSTCNSSRMDGCFVSMLTPACVCCRCCCCRSVQGMAYLHGYNPPVLHRYLRPSKLLVDADWKVKVRS